METELRARPLSHYEAGVWVAGSAEAKDFPVRYLKRKPVACGKQPELAFGGAASAA